MAVAEVVSKADMSDAEWQTRVDLAMLYRVLAKYRMTDLIYTHLTARVPGEPDTFLIKTLTARCSTRSPPPAWEALRRQLDREGADYAT